MESGRACRVSRVCCETFSNSRRIIPTGFFPLRYLSFSSALGITSTWALVGILIFSGIATCVHFRLHWGIKMTIPRPHSPGALREPAHTDLLPSHGLIKLGTVFGLLISGVRPSHSITARADEG